MLDVNGGLADATHVNVFEYFTSLNVKTACQ